jgi:DNA-directed RNA polymerase specialized sigma24 family protein
MAAASHNFPATRWTLLQALREGTETDAKEALELLCRAYWTPLYIVARSNGLNGHDAEDAVQGFFESLLENETLNKADQTRGMLRTFLLAAFDNYRIKVWRDRMTLKRGGQTQIIHYSDSAEAEERFLQIASQGEDIVTLYNREWARRLLARSLKALRQDHVSRGLEARFDSLVVHITQVENEDTQALAAEKAGMSWNSFRAAVFRLRRNYREKIEDELAITLGTRDPEVIRQEMHDLFTSFA